MHLFRNGRRDVQNMYVCLSLHSALGPIVQLAESMKNLTLICVCFKCTNENLPISGFLKTWSFPQILPCVVIGPLRTLPVAPIARPKFILSTQHVRVWDNMFAWF